MVFLVYRDVFDGAVFVEFQPKPRLETVLAFVVRARQRLGLPDALQVDNSDVFGLTSHPGSLSCFVRLALLVGIDLTDVPEHEPWRNGAIEHFNGWLQERLLAIPLHSPSQVRRELAAMMDTCFREHIHPDLNFQTTSQVRQNLSPRHFASQLPPTSATIARANWPRYFYPARTSVWAHHYPGSKIQGRQTSGPSICHRDPSHAHDDPQDSFWKSPDQAVRLPIRWQAATVSNPVALIFQEVSSVLTWRFAHIH